MMTRVPRFELFAAGLVLFACGLGELEGLSGGRRVSGSAGASGTSPRGDAPPSCSNARLDEGETAPDCGGPCSPCAAGSACTQGSDCTSRVCVDGVCSNAVCNDGIKNQDEERTDCGGSCSPCSASTCSDGVKNAGESDVDCGAVCRNSRCAVGKACSIDMDCSTRRCVAGRCLPGARSAYWEPNALNGTLEAIANIPWAELDVLNIAFATVSPAYECSFWNEGHASVDVSARETARAVIAYRDQHHPTVRIMLGVSSSDNLRLREAITELRRARFAASCVNLMLALRASGLDFDFRSSELEPRDLSATLRAVQHELAELGVRGKLTSAILRANRPNDPGNIAYEYDRFFAETPRLLDYVNLATHELHKPNEPTVNFSAPYDEVSEAMSYAREQVGRDFAHALVLSVPFAGAFWSDVASPEASGSGMSGTPQGLISYAQAKAQFLESSGAGCQVLAPSSGSVRNRYLYCPGSVGKLKQIWVSYEDPSVVAHKARFAQSNGYAGIAWWMHGQDTQQNELATAIYRAMPIGQAPFADRPWSIPGKIQAEDYDFGGPNIAYLDSTPESAGVYRCDAVDIIATRTGYAIGGITTNEWLAYSVEVEKTGVYNLEIRAANAVPGKHLRLDVAGASVAEWIDVPDSGGLDGFTTIEQNGIMLAAGRHVVQLVSAASDLSVDWLRFSEGQTPYFGEPHKIPGTIEVEHFDVGGPELAYHTMSFGSGLERARGPWLDRCTDIGAGFHLGRLQPGEWLEYTVDVAHTGEYNLEVRFATIPSDRRVHIEFDRKDVSGAISLPTTREREWWATFELNKVMLTKGRHVMRVASENGDALLNWVRFSEGQVPHQLPEIRSPHTIPGLVQAEDFDVGGPGVAYFDKTPGNQKEVYRRSDVDIDVARDAGGGYNVYVLDTGEWLEYTVDVKEAGLYELELRVATQRSTAALHFEVEGVTRAGPIVLPDTGDYQQFQTVKLQNVELAAGVQVLRLATDSAGVSVNWFRFNKL